MPPYTYTRCPAHLEMASVALLASHHDPHGAPLRDEERLDHPRDLIHERDGARDVVDDVHVPHLPHRRDLRRGYARRGCETVCWQGT
jgi:hypothetical protein